MVLQLFGRFAVFSWDRVVLYTLFMVFSLPETVVKILAPKSGLEEDGSTHDPFKGF